MKATYTWLARLIAIGVVLQAAFIAFGTFEIFNAANDGKVFTEDTDYNTGQALHSVVGMMIIPLFAVVLLILSFFAKIPGGARVAGIVVALVALQIVLGLVSFPVPAIGLLHGINAFAIAGVAGYAGRQAEEATATGAKEPAST